MSREDISKRFSEYAKKRRAAEAKSGGQSGSSDWRDRYMAYKAKRDAAEGKLEASVGALGDRVSKWRENAGKYYTDYATRYDVEEGSYVYRGDTEDYLNGVTAGRDDLNREAESIRRELEFYKPYVSEEYYNYLIGALDGSIKGDDGSVITFDTVVDNATRDHDFYSQFEDEGAYRDNYYNYAAHKKYGNMTAEEINAAWKNVEEEYNKYVSGHGDTVGPMYVPEELQYEYDYLNNRRNYLTTESEYYEILGEINIIAKKKEYYDAILEKGFNPYSEEEAQVYRNAEKESKRLQGELDSLNTELDDYNGFVYSKYQDSEYFEVLANEGEARGDSNYTPRDYREIRGWPEPVRPSNNQDVNSDVDEVMPGRVPEETESNAEEPNVLEQFGKEVSDFFWSFFQDSPHKDQNKVSAIRNGYETSETTETEELAAKHFTEEEFQLYNYLWQSDQEHKLLNSESVNLNTNQAGEYLEYMEGELKWREAYEGAKWFEDKPALGVLYSIPVGLDQFASGIEGIFKNEYDPSVTSLKGQIIREQLADDGKILWYDISNGSWEEMKVLGSSGAQALYDIGSTTANMLPSILVSVAVEAALPTVGEGGVVFAGLTGTQIATGAGALTMGASAMGNAKQEMLSMGYSVEQATAYGLMVGASEAGLSYLLSGIPGLRGGDGVFSALGQKAITKVDNALAKAAIALGGDMLDEGLEEGLQTVLEGWFKEIATGVDFEDPSAEEILYSSLLGALTAAGFGGGKLAIDYIGKKSNEYVSAKQNHKLLSIVNKVEKGQFDPKERVEFGTVDERTASKIKSLTGIDVQGFNVVIEAGQINHILLDHGKNGKTDKSMSDNADIAKMEYAIHNFDDISLGKHTKAYKNTINGRTQNAKTVLYEKSIGEKSYYVVQAVPDTKAKTLYVVTAFIGQKGYKNGASQLINAKGPNATSEFGSATAPGATQLTNEKNLGPTSKTEIASAPIDSISQESGFVNSENLSTPVGQANYYASILKMGENGTRGLVNLSSNMPDGVDLGEVAIAYNAIYNQGKQGKALSAVKNMELLSPEQRQYAYNLGIMDRALDSARAKKEGGYPPASDVQNSSSLTQRDTAPAGAAADRTKPEFLDNDKVEKAQAKVDAAKRTDGKKKKGTVIYDGDRSKLSDMQKKSLDVLDRVAEALGVTFRIYESEMVNGRFVYKMPDGVVKSANGWYDPKTGEIWLDINAGLNGEGTLIFTAAHELTHFIKQWSPAKFKIFADFLIEQYGEHGISIDELVQRRIDKAKKKGEDIDPDTAYEEVIADSCETFLRDSNAVEKIVELNQKDASLAQKIKQFLRDMLKRLRELMKGMDPDSLEGKVVAEMTESLEQLHKLWTDALADAGEAYSGAGSSSNKTSKVMYCERDSSNNSFNPDGKTLKEQLKEAFDTSESKERRYVYVGKFTNDFINKVRPYIDIKNYPIVMNYRDAYLSMESKDRGKYQGEGINYHNMGIDGLESALNSFDNPEYILLSTKKSKIELILQGKDYKNRPLFSIVEVNTKTQNNQKFIDVHVVTSVYGNKNIFKRIADAETDNRLIYKKEESTQGMPQVQYERDVNANSSANSISHDLDNVNNKFSESKEKFSDRDPDALTNREILANLLETEDMTPSEKGFLTKYKNKLSTIEAAEAEIAKMEAELKELKKKGKKDSSRAITLEGKIETLKKEISRDERLTLNLEATKPIRELLKRETDSAYKKAATEGNNKLAEYKEKVRAREERIKQERRDMRERASDRRHSSEIKNKIKAFKEKLQKTLRHPTDRKYIPGALAQAMIDVCELIDTDTELYKADGSINKAQERREKTRESLRLLRAEYNNIKNDSDPLYAGEFDEVIAAYLDTLEGEFSGKSLDEMSRSELERMYEILHSIDETLREARKLIGWKEAVDVYESGDVIISEQKKIAGKRKNGKRNLIKKANDGLANQSLSPVRRVLEICGYDRNSPLYKLFKGFEKGVREAHFFEMGAKKSFEALTTGKNAKIYEKAIYTSEGGNRYTDVNGRVFGISKMQKMQAILSFEREVANKRTHHIEKGGFVFADLGELTKGRLNVAIDAEHSHKVTGSEAVKLIEQFKKELESDRWAQDYMAASRIFFNETAKNAINDAYMKLKHRILATDLAYIPFEVDRNSIVREISAKYDIQETISSYGMLQEMQSGASNALIMTGLNNMLERHIEQVSTIHGLAVPIRNFNKVWSVRSTDGATNVKEQIQATAGAGATKLIEQTVMDLQGERSKQLPLWYKKVKSNYIGAQFFMNTSVMLKQIGSLFSSVSVLNYRDPVRMMANLGVTAIRHKKIAAEVDQYTATAWMRRQGLSDAELQLLSSEKRRTWFGKFLQLGSKGMIAMDYTVALSLWKYAKQDVAKKTGLRGEELMKATAEFYDEVIENTQSMTDVLHRPEVQRSGGVGTELFGTFKTDLYQNAGNLRMAVGEFTHNRTKENAAKVAKTVGSIMTSALWASMVTSIIAALRYKVDRYRDEEDELTAESWLKVQGADLVVELAGYALPLFGSEAIDIAFGVWSGSGAYSDNYVYSISFDAINDVFAALTALSAKSEDSFSFEDFEPLIIACGSILGIPASNILRVRKAFLNHARDFANGEPLSFNEGYYSSKKISKMDKLYRAMINDDEDRIGEISGQFNDESEVKSAIKKAIREKDPRVQVAVEAVMSYDYRSYLDLRDEIIEEGHFDYKTVKTAFEDEREYVLRKLKEAREEKKKGDLEDYEAIIEALIERGYSEEFIEKKLKYMH